MMILGAGTSVLFAVLPPVSRQLGLSEAGVGFIFASGAAFWLFCSPIWGRVSDRRGRRPILIIGMVGYAVSMLLVALFLWLGEMRWIGPTFLLVGLLVSRALYGVIGAGGPPAAQAYVADRTGPGQRTDEIAALTAIFALGAALGQGLCGLLAAAFGIVLPLALFGILGIAAAIAIHRYLPETRAPSQFEGGGQKPKGNAWRLLRDARVTGFVVFGAGLSVVAGALMQTYGFYVMDLLKVDSAKGIEYASSGFMVSALAMLSTQLALLPRLQVGVRALMALGAVILTLGVFVQLIAFNLSALMLSQLVQGVGLGLARAGFAGGASLAVTDDEQGEVAGLIASTNSFGFIVSPIAGSLLYYYGGIHAPLWMMLATLVLMTVFVMRSRRLRAVTRVRVEIMPDSMS